MLSKIDYSIVLLVQHIAIYIKYIHKCAYKQYMVLCCSLSSYTHKDPFQDEVEKKMLLIKL